MDDEERQRQIADYGQSDDPIDRDVSVITALKLIQERHAMRAADESLPASFREAHRLASEALLDMAADRFNTLRRDLKIVTFLVRIKRWFRR